MDDFDTKLKEYNDKMEAQYNVDLNMDDPVEMAQKIRNDLVPWIPTFMSTIVHLAKNAKSEQVRLKASTYGLETVYGKGIIGEVEDGINRLINDLTKSGPTGKSPHED